MQQAAEEIESIQTARQMIARENAGLKREIQRTMEQAADYDKALNPKQTLRRKRALSPVGVPSSDEISDSSETSFISSRSINSNDSGSYDSSESSESEDTSEITDGAPVETTIVKPYSARRRYPKNGQVTNQELLDIERLVSNRMAEMIKILDVRVEDKQRSYVN